MMMMMAPKVQTKILPKLIIAVLIWLKFHGVESAQQLSSQWDLKMQQRSSQSNLEDKWRLVFKAVAGAGGDIYQLWNSNQALNEDKTKAKQLNNDLKAHYKSSAVNNWTSQRIKYVKVVLYQAGIERLVLVFNAVGSDKMSWFTKSRLISSPYADIETALTSAKGYSFSILGEQGNAARHFYINKSYGGCENDIGWLSVVNRAHCPYERVPGYPAFIYAPGHSAIRFGIGTQAHADVFAIFTATK